MENSIKKTSELQRKLLELKFEQDQVQSKLKRLTSTRTFRVWQSFNSIKKSIYSFMSIFIDMKIKYSLKNGQDMDAVRTYKKYLKIKRFLANNEDVKQKSNIKVHELSCIKSHALKHKSKYEIIYPEQYVNVFPPYYFNDRNKIVKKVKQPEIYLAEFKKVSIVGNNNFILTNDGKCLIDFRTQTDAKRIDVLYGCVKYFEKKSILIDIPRGSKKIIERGILLSGIASYNYYHWLIDYLSRLQLINNKNEYSDIPLIVDQICKEIPQLKQSLNILKARGQQVIYIKPDQQYHVKRLIVPSQCSWNVINLKKNVLLKETDSLISKQAINFLRNNSLFLVGKTGSFAKRIYISRYSTKSRKFNEFEIQNIFIKSGFSVIYPEKMTFAEQVKVFSNAQIIAGATGAGLSNIIFSPPKAKIICLVSQKMDFSGFSNIAGLNSQEMIFLAGKPILDNTLPYYQANFYMDPDYVRHALKTILSPGYSDYIKSRTKFV
jgi:hypothetical protein